MASNVDQVEDDDLKETLQLNEIDGNVNNHPITAADLKEDVESYIDGDQEHVLFEAEEGGWGWLVCFASFWANGTVCGVLNSFGVVYVEMLNEFDGQGDTNLAFKISWIGALQIFMTFFMSLFTSILVDTIGIRVTACAGAVVASVGMLASSCVREVWALYLTYGGLLGFGLSLVYSPSLVILGHYFHKRLGIVNGIVSFGSAVFTMIMPYAIQYLRKKMGLWNTLRSLTGLFAVLIPLSLVWISKIPKRPWQTQVSSGGPCQSLKYFFLKVFDKTIWKNKGYVIWTVALTIAMLGYFIPFVHLVNHVQHVMPDHNGAILVMCIGLTSGLSRLVVGKVADFPGVSRILMQQLSLIVFGVVLACIPFVHHFNELIVLALVMGISDGCFICLLGPIAFDILGPQGATQGLGWFFAMTSVPMTIGPPLAGLIFDMMDSYNLAFWLGSIPPLIGATMMFYIPPKKETMKSLTIIATIVTPTESNENNDQIDARSNENICQIGDSAMNHLERVKDSPDDTSDILAKCKGMNTPQGEVMPKNIITVTYSSKVSNQQDICEHLNT